MSMMSFGKYSFGIIYHGFYVGKRKNIESCQISKCSLFLCSETSLHGMAFRQGEPQSVCIGPEQGRVGVCVDSSSFCRLCQLNKNKNYHAFKTSSLKTPLLK